MIIDIHTHIFNEKVYQDYIKKSKGNASKIFVIDYFKENYDKVLEFVKSKNNLYFIGNVNVDKDIDKQLKVLEKLFKKKILYGIKLYPGYQYFYPSDKKIYPIAKLCEKYGKPLIFHSGDVYDPENVAMLKYSHPMHIDELAVKFPKCKIIISHFGFPYYLETANIVSKNENVYTDISGTIDQDGSDKDLKDLIDQYEKDLKRVFFYFSDVKRKVMFGTDYAGEHTPLSLVEPYIDLVKRIFNKEEQEIVFYKLANKVFFN